MVYSDYDIATAIENGHIVVYPKPHRINGASVNVTLGEWFFTTDKDSGSMYYNPFSAESVTNYFGEPKRAIEHGIWAKKNHTQLFDGIESDRKIIVLRPGERILCHTQEFIGINPPGAMMIKARSTIGRNGIAVCFDAGWGDPGYINRWTLEVFNLNQYHAIPLPVGLSIAQIVFLHTGPVKKHYASDGNYQNSTDLEELIANWKPELMLPRVL